MGFNYKLNNLLSCVGIAQIKKLNMFIKKKKIIHEHYVDELGKINGVNIFRPGFNISSNYWFNIITFKNFNKNNLKNLDSFVKKIKLKLEKSGDLPIRINI